MQGTSFQRLGNIQSNGSCGSGSCNCASSSANPPASVSNGMMSLSAQPVIGTPQAVAQCGIGGGCNAQRQQIVPAFGAFGFSLAVPNTTGGDYFKFSRAYGNCSNFQAGMVQPTGCWQ